MNTTRLFLKPAYVGFLATSAIILTLTGCAMDAPNGEVVVASPGVVVQEDYVYYPSYGIYYSSSRRQYASLSGGAWVSEPAPRGVSVDVLTGSPSVKMDFHDSPANHHAAVAKQYPKNWKPSADQKGGRPDEHGTK
jgi:hypothetical protein